MFCSPDSESGFRSYENDRKKSLCLYVGLCFITYIYRLKVNFNDIFVASILHQSSAHVQMFRIAINNLFEWLFSRLPQWRPVFDSRPGHVSPLVQDEDDLGQVSSQIKLLCDGQPNQDFDPHRLGFLVTEPHCGKNLDPGKSIRIRNTDKLIFKNSRNKECVSALLAAAALFLKKYRKIPFKFLLLCSVFGIPSVQTRQNHEAIRQINQFGSTTGNAWVLKVIEHLRYRWAPSARRPRMSGSGEDTRGEHSTCLDSQSGPE